jgi:hypothetical protein
MDWAPGNRIAQVVGGDEVWLVRKDGKGLKRNRLTPKGTNYHYHDLKIIEGKAYVVNTDLSRVDVFNTRNWTFEDHTSPLVQGADKEIDACHFNSIYLDPLTRHMFGCAFGLTPTREAWREDQSGGVFFKFASDRLIPLVKGFRQPHSVVVVGKYAFLCDSIPGDLVVMSWGLRAWTTSAVYHVGNGFARGLALHEDGYYVGLSANRHPQNYGYDHRYDLENARIVNMNVAGEVVDQWDLPVKEVYGILVEHEETDPRNT